jgi:putative addiction module killer protein
MLNGLMELGIDWGPGYRIYLAQDGKQLIVLFGGGTKKNQQSDINRARELYQEYKRRKKEISKEQKFDNDSREKR